MTGELTARPDVRLQFIPTHDAWLNLIGPWWTLVKALALNGRRVETVAERRRGPFAKPPRTGPRTATPSRGASSRSTSPRPSSPTA